MTRFFKISMIFILSILISAAVMAGACENSECCTNMKDINVTAVNTDSGVMLAYVARTPEALKAIRQKLESCEYTKKCDICGMKGVKREVRNTDKGAVMILTAEKTRTVRKLQKAVAEENPQACEQDPNKSGCSAEQKKTCPHAK